MNNPAPLQDQSFTIPAATNANTPGVKRIPIPGVMVYVRKASGPYSLQLNANTPFAAEEGFKFTDPANPFQSLTFFNYQAAPINLTIFIGALGVDFLGANEFKPAATYPLGNFGIGPNAAVATVFGQQVTVAAIAQHGHGYVVGDILRPPDGTGVPCQIQVDQISSAGAIKKVTIIAGGNYSVTPATPCTPIGGTGAAAQFNLTFAALTGATVAIAGNWLTITQGGALTVPNGLGDNARKLIKFKVKANSATALLVTDAAGNTIREIAAGEEEPIECPGVFKIIAATAALCTFTAYELYYL
jgi:hypothetical protein